jgi:hypothetical protein
VQGLGHGDHGGGLPLPLLTPAPRDTTITITINTIRISVTTTAAAAVIRQKRSRRRLWLLLLLLLMRRRWALLGEKVGRVEPFPPDVLHLDVDEGGLRAVADDVVVRPREVGRVCLCGGVDFGGQSKERVESACRRPPPRLSLGGGNCQP